MDEQVFTADDMRRAFIAGEEFEKDSLLYDMDRNPEITAPDFGDWMLNNYNLKID